MGTTNKAATLEKSRLQAMAADYGVPRMIITGFLLLLFVMAPFVGVNLPMQITNIINRFSWTRCWCWPWCP